MKFMPSNAYDSQSRDPGKALRGHEEGLNAAVSLSIFFSGVIYPDE
jgi:hypothetical protein